MNNDSRITAIESRLAVLERVVDASTRPMAELDIISRRLSMHSAAFADELTRINYAIHELRQWSDNQRVAS